MRAKAFALEKILVQIQIMLVSRSGQHHVADGADIGGTFREIQGGKYAGIAGENVPTRLLHVAKHEYTDGSRIAQGNVYMGRAAVYARINLGKALLQNLLGSIQALARQLDLSYPLQENPPVPVQGQVVLLFLVSPQGNHYFISGA